MVNLEEIDTLGTSKFTKVGCTCTFIKVVFSVAKCRSLKNRVVTPDWSLYLCRTFAEPSQKSEK